MLPIDIYNRESIHHAVSKKNRKKEVCVMSKKSSITVIFPKDLLKKVDEDAFTKFTSRSDFVRTVINDYFMRAEKTNEEKKNFGNQIEK